MNRERTRLSPADVEYLRREYLLREMMNPLKREVHSPEAIRKAQSPEAMSETRKSKEDVSMMVGVVIAFATGGILTLMYLAAEFFVPYMDRTFGGG